MANELNDILQKVNKIFKSVLDDESLNIKQETTAEDIDEWDSLSHIQLIVAIEKEFSIRFTSDEIENYINVGDMCKGILQKKVG